MNLFGFFYFYWERLILFIGVWGLGWKYELKFVKFKNFLFTDWLSLSSDEMTRIVCFFSLKDSSKSWFFRSRTKFFNSILKISATWLVTIYECFIFWEDSRNSMPPIRKPCVTSWILLLTTLLLCFAKGNPDCRFLSESWISIFL